MGYTIAVAGKGGTGKTTVAGLIIDWLLKQKKGSVLAIDADPNANLGSALGVEPQENIGEIVDSIAKDPSLVPSGMSKNEYINYRIQTSLSESNGFDLLVMGRPEGPGCYCYVNNVLRQNLQKLTDNYDVIVIDNEAGMEHFSRRTTRSADCLVLVSDYSITGIRTVKNIYNLVKELDINIKKELLLVNRVKESNDMVEQQIKNSGIEYLESLPEDEDLLELSVKGLPTSALKDNSVILKIIERIGEKLWR